MRAHADQQPAAQIKVPHLRLVWTRAGAPEARWYLALVGYIFRGTPRRLLILVSVRGLLVWSAGAVVAAYFGGAALLAWHWGRNPYNHVSYADLVLPTRWSGLGTKRGQGKIDEGIHHIRRGQYATGLMLLGRGIQLKPDDLRGRLVLAQAYVNLGYLYRGVQLLEEGLDFGVPPKSYYESLLRLTAYLEDYERLIDQLNQLERLLPPGETAVRRRLMIQRVTALEKLQLDDELEQLRNASLATPIFALESAWARSLARRGRPEDALREIARDPDRFGVAAERCQLQLAMAVAARDVPAADAAARAWFNEEPAAALPRIEQIGAHIKLGRPAEARDRLERFFISFSSDRSAVLLLFRKLMELAEADWLKLARREAEDAGVWTVETRILYVQGLMMAGRVTEALTEFNFTAELVRQNKASNPGWVEGTQRLIEVIISDSPSSRSQFLAFFRTNRLAPDAFRFALISLRQSGANEVASELALLARNRFPALREALVDSAPAAVAGTQQARRPTGSLSTETLARAELRLIDADLDSGDTAAALGRLRKLEAAPSALPRAELLVRRIELHGRLDELTELAAALQLYLASPGVSQSWLRQCAERWQADGRTGSAIVLARETRLKFPEAQWTASLLRPDAPPAGASPAGAAPVAVRSEAEGRELLAQVDADLQAGRPQEALQRIKAIERARITPLLAELPLRRIRAHGALREQTELAAAAGYYLSGKEANLAALRDLALQWDNEAQRDSALTLLREIIVRFPQARWAFDLRKKIEGDLLIAPEGKSLEVEKP